MEYHEAAPRDEVEVKVRRMAEEGMRFRGQKIIRVESVAAEHTVEKKGAAFAAVVLWD
jgi:arginine decarboxylase